MSRNGSRRFENGTKQISAHKDLKGQCPESVIGRGVNIRGTLSFEKLLRIDGQFEGQLISKGSLIIGSEGVLIGNIQNMSALVLDGGKLYGNVVVDKLFLRGASYLKGDVCCKYLTVDKHATLMGNCNIHPLAPEIIDENGDIIIPNEVIIVVDSLNFGVSQANKFLIFLCRRVKEAPGESQPPFSFDSN